MAYTQDGAGGGNSNKSSPVYKILDTIITPIDNAFKNAGSFILNGLNSLVSNNSNNSNNVQADNGSKTTGESVGLSSNPGNLNYVSAGNVSNGVSSYNSFGDDYTSQMRFNAQQAALEREWSEYMSNTSHQREVKDLIAAGLNPILSANNGAASYHGASASSSESLDTAKMNAQLALKLAGINTASAERVASIYNEASHYAADTSAAASIYNTDKNFINQGIGNLIKLIV